MPKAKREDLQIKIPALLHLSRLGYSYLSRAQLRRRDRRTNLLPDMLRTAAERINGIRFTQERFARLMEDIRAQLEADDLGRQFYGTLRSGWEGLRLIDFEHPENNLFQSAAELACGSGAGSFRPDMTLFVNGLPLAMVEVKNGDRSGGLQAEYNRMLERIRNPEGRRYLQCAQIWAFSDDHEHDPDRFLPTEGAFFATVMTDDFPVYAVRGKASGASARLLPADPEEERKILGDNGIREKPRSGSFRRSLSPRRPTHRMLTELFRPARFLFLLRYGIRYIMETDREGTVFLTRRMLTIEQLSALAALTGKAERGCRNWTVPSFGAAGEKAFHASLVTLLRDLIPGAELYWVSPDAGELKQDQAALQSCGIPCARQEEAAEGRLMLLIADTDPEAVLRKTGEFLFAGRRVFVLPEPVPKYGPNTLFAARLRRADPHAILVTRKTGRMPESGSGLPLSARTDSVLFYFASARTEIRAENNA